MLIYFTQLFGFKFTLKILNGITPNYISLLHQHNIRVLSIKLLIFGVRTTNYVRLPVAQRSGQKAALVWVMVCGTTCPMLKLCRI